MISDEGPSNWIAAEIKLQSRWLEITCWIRKFSSPDTCSDTLNAESNIYCRFKLPLLVATRDVKYWVGNTMLHHLKFNGRNWPAETGSTNHDQVFKQHLLLNEIRDKARPQKKVLNQHHNKIHSKVEQLLHMLMSILWGAFTYAAKILL